jgi:membrane associated rhomboid family serine protease
MEDTLFPRLRTTIMPDDWDFSTKTRAEHPLPIITYGLCILCVLFTLANWYPNTSPVAARAGAFATPDARQIWDGAYYGLITTFFAHVDLVHIVFNMLWLVQLGRVMEPSLPPWAYFLFLVAAAAVSMGCELAVMGHAGIGASGVVYAMFGLMWVGKAKYRDWGAVANRYNLNVFIIWGVYCIFGTIAGFMPVANVAHFSGLLFGMSVGWLFLAPRRKLAWVYPVIGMAALAITSLFWLPWSSEWANYKGDKAFEAKNYPAAIEWYHRSLRLGGPRYYNWENMGRAWYQIAVAAERAGNGAEADRAAYQAIVAKRLEGPDPETQPEPAGRFNLLPPGAKR